MPIVKHYAHPFAGGAPHVCEVENVGEWLLETFGDTPTVTALVFAGEPSAETNITGNIHALIASDAPEYTVLQSPGGAIFPGLDFILIGAAVADYFRPPSIPDLSNTTRGSSNNALSDRSNKVRILERIEDIYGTVRSIPSLIAPTYTKYINHIQYEYAYLCVGRGYYDISDMRDGETPFADIDGARAAVFNPFTSPNSGDAPVMTIGGAIEDDVLTVRRSNEVDGITLKALNQIQLPDGMDYDFLPASVLGTTGDAIRQGQVYPSFPSVINSGDMLTVAMDDYSSVAVTASTISADASDSSLNDSAGGLGSIGPGSTITVSGFSDPANNGTFTVVTASASKITVSASLVTEAAGAAVTITTPVNYSGVYEVESVENDYIVLTTTTWPVQIENYIASVKKNDVSEWTSWVTLADTARTQIWANILALNGLYKEGEDGRITATVDVEIQIEELDASLVPTGNVETITESLSGATTDPRATTIETVTGFTGPCRFRIRRTTQYDYAFEGAVVDEVKIADLYSVSPVDKTHFGNITTIQAVTKATLRALAAKERQLNCLASRLIPTYDGSSFSGAFDSEGRHTSGTISATSRFVDIVAAVSVDPAIGGRNLATEVDMAQIYAVYQQVAAWGPQYAEFNYTFDSDNLSYEETVRQIADAVFCIAYRQNGKIRFSFDRAQTNPVVPTFCHRNKRPDSETITRNFAADSDYDGIELVYQDPDTERAETIKLPLDGSATKYRKVEIAGIRNYDQAWMRANREYNRLRHQRMVIETTATTDARALLPNSRIDVVDDTRFKRFGGEVLAVDGLTLTLSQPVEFAPGEPHSVLLKKRNGDSEGIAVTASDSLCKVVLQSLPSEEIVTTPDPETGIRTIYSFASDSQRQKQAWLVQEIIPQDRQYVQIRAINYTDAYYQHDTLPIPDKETVIYS